MPMLKKVQNKVKRETYGMPVRLPEDIYRAMQAQAREEGVTMVACVVVACRQYMERAPLWRRFLRAAAKGKVARHPQEVQA